MSTGMTDIKDGFSQTILDDFKALADEQYLGGTTPPIGDNDYLEPVSIPVYDSGDESHCLIGTDGDWNNTTLNDDTWEHFYVPAGDYSSTNITLTADGTDVARRTISLHNGNDTHPASMADGDQANVRIYFNGGSYWDLDRLSNIDDTTEPSIKLEGGASFNTINRLHMKEYYYGFMVEHLCDNNTIQNSYINHCSDAGRRSDNVGIALASSGFDGTRVLNTKIINNDIRNAGDGIQLVVSTGLTDVEYNGTIIDSNRIWFDEDAYTDGDGVYNPNGDYMLAENAFDFKTGSDDTENPVLVTNNIVWGAKATDPQGSLENGQGSLSVSHGDYNKNIKIRNNIFANSQGAHGTAGTMTNIEFTNNIVCHMNQPNPLGRFLELGFWYDSANTKIENNSYIDADTGNWVKFQTQTGTGSFSNNISIDITAVNTPASGGIATITNNYYYNNPTKIPATGTEEVYATGAEANMTDYSFQYEIFTTAPKSKTLTGIISTASSPHFGVAGSDIE